MKNMTDTEQEEVWKTHPDYDFIEVSNLGRIRTKDRIVIDKNGIKRVVKGRVLKQRHDKNGYMCVNFSVNGKTVTLKAHRAVAICFIPNPNNYPEVNHKDNNRANNVVSNLEWCTNQYNIDYKKNFGTSAAELLGKPVIAVNLETSEVFWFESQSEAARQLGVFPQNIYAVVKGKRNKIHGYWFCNADEIAVEKTREKFGDKVAHEVEKLIGENYD